ncbi:MAG: hypothetical protein ACYSW7_06420, partial [Planctomycetota bacterium]
DLLEGKGSPIDRDLLEEFAGTAVRFKRERGGLKVTAVDSKASEIRFSLNNVPCGGQDLFILLTARGNVMQGYPPEVARLMYVGSVPKGQQVGDAAGKDDRFMTWINGSDFDSGFYFSDIESNQVDLEFVVEGSEPIWISRIQVYSHPDVMYREFEHGLVVANPSLRPYVFNLDELFPGQARRGLGGQAFQRLQGSGTQDVVANDGSAVEGMLNLGPKEGLFLMRGSQQ